MFFNMQTPKAEKIKDLRSIKQKSDDKNSYKNKRRN